MKDLLSVETWAEEKTKFEIGVTVLPDPVRVPKRRLLATRITSVG